MANRFNNPDIQFADSTGAPYAGGFLYFYASGTSTPLNTYSDSALTIANANPIELDSAGRAGSIFLQNLAYKAVLTDANGVQVWTEDPVSTSDFSAVAQFQTGFGSPNGTVAGTAGSLGIPASAYWDATSNILYVCTATGTVTTAVWTAVNATAAAAVVPPPQGYLTLTSGTPIIASDVIAATSVFYTPYVGSTVPIWNGSAFVPTTFAELSLALTSSQTANGLYDVFVFSNSGVLTLVVGPAWTGATAGSCARGTGAGTTQLTLVGGLQVNAVQITARNGSSTYTVPANQATYLGSLYIDGTAGQVTCHRSWGQNRKWGAWNAYNQAPLYLKAGDAANFGISTGPRAANNTPSSYTATFWNVGSGTAVNGLVIFAGLASCPFYLAYVQHGTVTSTGATSPIIGSGIGLNSISALTGKNGSLGSGNASGFTNAGNGDLVSEYEMPPSLGINNITAMEQTSVAGAAQTFFGTEASMVLSARWFG